MATFAAQHALTFRRESQSPALCPCVQCEGGHGSARCARRCRLAAAATMTTVLLADDIQSKIEAGGLGIIVAGVAGAVIAGELMARKDDKVCSRGAWVGYLRAFNY